MQAATILLTGHQFPYTFTIYQNSTGKDEQVNLQYVTATPFFWDNNQPVGTFLKFSIVDVNNFVSTTDYVQVSVGRAPALFHPYLDPGSTAKSDVCVEYERTVYGFTNARPNWHPNFHSDSKSKSSQD
ncbi:hypothetical protein FRC10_010400 [Ceratobasidium sp. 414]|nr:hypothetical protein FRC10_010400 [Ceratobasidium sp. 414]